MNISSRLWFSTKKCLTYRVGDSFVRPQSSFMSQTLPQISEVHHPRRVQNKTLYPWCDTTIPEIPYCEFLWDNLDTHAHLPGLVCGLTDRTLLHGEIKETSLQVSRSLRSLGLQKGDVVGLLLPNCLEYPLLVQGCLHSGLTITPMNPAYTAHEISRQLNASKAKVLFTHASILEKVKETMKLYPNITETVIIDGVSKNGDLSWDDFMNISSGPLPDQIPVDIKKDVAILPFSSGTTGVPKGVMLSQHNLVVNNYTMGANDPDYMARAFSKFQDVTIGVLPMFHIFGLNVTMSGGIHTGVKHVVLPTFDPQVFVKLLTKHKPTFLHLVPPLVSFLANSPAVTTEHLSTLRQVNVGAAPSGPNLINQFYKKAPRYVMYKEGWGSTEVAGGATGISRSHGGIKEGSVNQLFPNLRLQIRDIYTDEPKGPEESGEIVLKGPHNMIGYINNEKANEETFDKDGWMRTGDIGYYDEDGFLFIVDRMKELIKVKGLQVAPAELEDVLRSLDGVLDVGIIGIESEREGQVPRAYIVRKEGLTEDKIQEFMKVQVSAHKQLVGGIEFIEAIPKSAAGKILRKDLQAMYKESYHTK